MKDITLWKCDICGTEYRDKKQCQKCENNHTEGQSQMLLDLSVQRKTTNEPI